MRRRWVLVGVDTKATYPPRNIRRYWSRARAEADADNLRLIVWGSLRERVLGTEYRVERLT